SREIARLLGGEIHVASAVGEGSSFTLYLPGTYQEAPPRPPTYELDVYDTRPAGPNGEIDFGLDPSVLLPTGVEDDRATIEAGDRVVLIVDDDPGFAGTVLEVARSRGFKGVIATRGDAGLALAHEFKPDAIVLDIRLPVMDGWTVLDHLKHHPDTRHIPVHIVTGAEDGRQNALRAGAVAFLEKPADKDRI